MDIADAIIKQIDFNYQYAQVLVEDLTKEQMTVTPGKGLENHPAFTLGHLVSAASMVIIDLGGSSSMPLVWKEIFDRKGPGDPQLPDKDASKYPSKRELLDSLKSEYEQIKNLFKDKEATYFDQAVQWRLAPHFPNKMDALLFMCVSHSAMHLGQLAAWRRAMGLSSALRLL